MYTWSGLAAAALWAADFKFRNMSIRSSEAQQILTLVALVDVVVVLSWIWPLLADAVNIAFLVSDVAPQVAAMAIEGWKSGAVAVAVSLVLARIVRGWWLWILGLEVVLAVVLLIALTVAGGIMRLWIESVQTQRADKLKEWRQSMRRHRKAMEDEIAELRRRLPDKGTR